MNVQKPADPVQAVAQSAVEPKLGMSNVVKGAIGGVAGAAGGCVGINAAQKLLDCK